MPELSWNFMNIQRNGEEEGVALFWTEKWVKTLCEVIISVIGFIIYIYYTYTYWF